jgi:DNA-binding response OmpR family regulator
MTRTILLADNDYGIRRFCRQELKAEGYRVIEACDGDEVLHVLDTFAIHLLILDEHMHRRNGLYTAHLVRQVYPELPIVLFTADPDLRDFRSPLINATVMKTADLGPLKAAIAEWMPDRLASPAAENK